MATEAQKAAARRNIRKAQEKWRSISQAGRSHAQANTRSRAKPGETGDGNYYHIEVRNRRDFSIFRNHDVGKNGGLQRVAGQRSDGSWDTVTWLVSKDFAHVRGKQLIADHQDAKDLFNKLGSHINQKKGDIFAAEDKSTPSKNPTSSKN